MSDLPDFKALGPRDFGSEELEDEIMRRLSSDNPKSRLHHEEYADGRSSWRCIPIRDAVEVRAAAIAALVATPPSPAPGLPLDAETVRALREALLRELPNIDRSIERRWVALAFDRAAMKVGARLAIDAATDKAEREWSKKLPKEIP